MLVERCLWCNQSLNEGCNVTDLLLMDDCLCQQCRRQFSMANTSFMLEQLKVTGLYWYEPFFSSLLIQYKECMDEALQDCFLTLYRKQVQRRYHDYVLIPMPSSAKKREERGFDTLLQLFSSLDLPMWDCLEKTKDFLQEGPRKQREKIQDLIQLKQPVKQPENKKYILVDDVCTTGSTLLSAKNCLQRAGIEVEQAFVLAMNLKWKKTKKKS